MLTKRHFRLLTDSVLFSRPLSFSFIDCSYVLSRHASASSSSRWTKRQQNDLYTRQAKVLELKSRAAFKLLQINEKYNLLKPGMTVVDLGYAPGSWSQVAVDRCAPNGRIIGIDIIPAAPPRGASSIQGDFLSPTVQASIRHFLSDPNRGRPRQMPSFDSSTSIEEQEHEQTGYLDLERHEGVEEKDGNESNTVDVVLSDMCEPWPLTEGYFKNIIKQPYFRMMNTSGIKLRDHGGSMDLCGSALLFCVDVLKPGGSFVCKFYQGAEDRQLEEKLKKVFEHVERMKPDSSRNESREAFFVARKKKANVERKTIEDMDLG